MDVPGRQFSQQCCEGFDLTDPIISYRLEFTPKLLPGEIYVCFLQVK
jgi:hypothetical protein